jgi:hypothetical protein
MWRHPSRSSGRRGTLPRNGGRRSLEFRESFHLATGGELVAPATKPAPGQIRDTNSALIDALTREYGAIVQAHARVGDNLSLTVKSAAEHPSDLLLISGGTSVAITISVRAPFSN